MSGGQFAAGAPGVATPMCPSACRLHARPARTPLPCPGARTGPASGHDEGHDEGHEHEQAPEGHDQDDDGHHLEHGHAPAPVDDEDHGHDDHGHEDHGHGEGLAAGRPRPGCLRNLLSSIGQTRACIRSTEPVIRCGSSTRSTSTITPSLPSDFSTPWNLVSSS